MSVVGIRGSTTRTAPPRQRGLWSGSPACEPARAPAASPPLRQSQSSCALPRVAVVLTGHLFTWLGGGQSVEPLALCRWTRVYVRTSSTVRTRIRTSVLLHGTRVRSIHNDSSRQRKTERGLEHLAANRAQRKGHRGTFLASSSPHRNSPPSHLPTIAPSLPGTPIGASRSSGPRRTWMTSPPCSTASPRPWTGRQRNQGLFAEVQASSQGRGAPPPTSCSRPQWLRRCAVGAGGPAVWCGGLEYQIIH
jgi:hypothetical protein